MTSETIKLSPGDVTLAPPPIDANTLLLAATVTLLQPIAEHLSMGTHRQRDVVRSVTQRTLQLLEEAGHGEVATLLEELAGLKPDERPPAHDPFGDEP